MNNLHNIACLHCNQFGKDYLKDLNTYRDQPVEITALHFTESEDNWFYAILSSGSVLYLSKKSTCKSGFFGDLRYYLGQKRNIIHKIHK